MTDLYFWAQSLDNQAPDEIFKNEVKLSDDESRQKLVSEIYAIPKTNIKVLPANAGVTMRYSYPKFVIEAISTQQDTIKRLAPIVIYGVLRDVSKDGGKDVLYNRIVSGVSDKLNRNLDRSALEVIQNGLSEILNNKNPRFELEFFQFILNFLLLRLQSLEALRERNFNKVKQAFKKIIG